MRAEISTVLSRVNRRNLTNNSQRALYRLLSADGEWVPRTQIRVPSVGSRVRDLRTPKFGQFQVECATSTDLKRRVRDGRVLTYYRIKPATVTQDQVTRAFRTQ